MHDVVRPSSTRSQRAASFVGRLLVEARATASLALRRLPSWCWPLLVAASTWPSAAWTMRRLLDDSDDPLGFVALATLLLATWRARRRFERAPRSGLLALASLLALVSNGTVRLPDLVRALVANSAIVVALAAIADRASRSGRMPASPCCRCHCCHRCPSSPTFRCGSSRRKPVHG